MRRLRRAFRRLRERLEKGAVILMYHRIAELDLDPWEVAVSPDHFEAHLRLIRTLGRPIGLRTLVEDLRRGRVVPGSVVVTFDDGYLDNLTAAKPLLERYEVPATVFVTTRKMEVAREFWWEELEQLILHPETLPGTLEIELPGGFRNWALGEAARIGARDRDSQVPLWKAPAGTRLALYWDLYSTLRSYNESDRDEALGMLSQWADVPIVSRASHRTVSPDELRSLASGGLIEIGAHTRTHPFLSNLAASEQAEEVLDSKQKLEEALQSPVVSFAYPHGDSPPESIVLARAQFECACGIDPQPTLAGDDPWILPRFGVPDCDGPTFSTRFLR